MIYIRVIFTIIMNSVGKKIINDLQVGGYSVQTLDRDSFLKICEDLGDIINTTQIRLTSNSLTRNLLAKPEAIPFHTDHPEIDIIAWYCIDPGSGNDNHMHFIDGRDVINKLTAEELNNLMSVMVRFPPLNNRLGGEYPLLTTSSDEPHLYYAPWLVLPNYSSSILRSLGQFQRFLISSDLIEIELTINTCLFVNNRRILHGRNPIETHSSRQLERNWIQVG